MKNKIMAILGAAVVLAGVIGGAAFASGVNNNTKDNQLIVARSSNVVQDSNDKSKDSTNYNQNSVNNQSKDIYQDMIKIMKDNGFKDAAIYMQTGNYAAMRDYMNNLSQEDYDKMIKIMDGNGYGYMVQMMQSIGKERMTQMHNSMMGNF